MKKKLIIVAIVIILLLIGYVSYVKFIKKSLPTGTMTELQTKLTALQYQLLNAKKAGQDTTALQKEVDSYSMAIAKSSFTGSYK